MAIAYFPAKDGDIIVECENLPGIYQNVGDGTRDYAFYCRKDGSQLGSIPPDANIYMPEGLHEPIDFECRPWAFTYCGDEYVACRMSSYLIPRPYDEQEAALLAFDGIEVTRDLNNYVVIRNLKAIPV